MNADFVRCCDFLARMIEKYGPEIRAENIVHIVLSDVDEWKSKPSCQEDRIFRYMECLYEQCGMAA